MRFREQHGKEKAALLSTGASAGASVLGPHIQNESSFSLCSGLPAQLEGELASCC
jgi:hypothetical protein